MEHGYNAKGQPQGDATCGSTCPLYELAARAKGTPAEARRGHVGPGTNSECILGSPQPGRGKVTIIKIGGVEINL